MNKRIYLSPPHMSGVEIEMVANAFAANWIAPVGPDLTAFEQEICAYTGAPHAVALSSGTAAIHLALKQCGVRPGDHVVCSSFTFGGSAFPIAYCGGIPVFIDSDLRTWNMDPNLFEKAVSELISNGKKPKAVLIVHLYGIPADLDPIIEISRSHGIAVIEDAAESLGAQYKGNQTGTIGDFGIYSFNGNKIITTSGGGVVVGHNREALEKIRFWSTQARDDAPHYQHSEIGFNYRMSNIIAAIGRGQLTVLNERVNEKRKINTWYRQLFDGVDGVKLMPDYEQGNHWLTCIVIDERSAGFSREDIHLAFERENIESRPLWKPMHCQPVFSGIPSFTNGVSEQLFAQGLCLPSGTAMDDLDRERIEQVLAKFTGNAPVGPDLNRL